MPTFADILDASPDVLTENAPVRNPAKATPAEAASPDFQSILEASPDLFPGRRNVAQREQRGPVGELVHAAIAPIKSLAKAPSLATMSDDEWYQWLKDENANEQAVDPAEGVLGGAARIAGSVAGGVAEFAGSEAIGDLAGPVGAVAAPAAAFAASGSVESARAAGLKAIQEGKPKEEVVKISRQLAGVGAVTGAGSALLFSGAALIPKTASALARTVGTAAIGTTAGVGGQLAENVAEKQAGLDVSPTEGVLEQAIVMGLLPVVAHAKDLYRQARESSTKARGILSTKTASGTTTIEADQEAIDLLKKSQDLRKQADAAAVIDLGKVDVTPSDSDTSEVKQAKEAVQKFVTGAELKTPKGAHPEEVGSERMAKELDKEIASEPTKPAILPKPDLANVAGSKFRPEVPGTEAEAEKGISVIDEIKASGAKTIADIQRLFPQAQLNREAARRLRDQAWGKQEPPPAKPKPPDEPPDDTGGTPVEKPPPKPPVAPDVTSPVTEAGSATGTTAGEETTPPAEPAKTEPVKPKEENASKVSPSTEVHGDLQPQPGTGEGEVSADESGKGVQPQTETPVSEASTKSDVKLGQWPESEWSYEHLKKLSMAERANRAKYLGLRDKEGMVEVSPKKIADRAKQRLDEIKAAAAKPKEEPPVEAKTLTPAIRSSAGTFTSPSLDKFKHDDILEANKEALMMGEPAGGERGFVDENGNWVSREQGAKWFKEKTGKDIGGELHSEHLNDAGLLEHLATKAPPSETIEPVSATEHPSNATKPPVTETPPPESKPVDKTPEHHVAIYGGKEVPIDYTDPKREFKVAAQRVRDNLKTGEKGYVRTPNGKLFEISTDSKLAKPVEKPTQAATPTTASPETPPASTASESPTAPQSAEDFEKHLRTRGVADAGDTTYKIQSNLPQDNTFHVETVTNGKRDVSDVFDTREKAINWAMRTAKGDVEPSNKSVDHYLNPPVPDVTEERSRVKAIDKAQADLRDEYRSLEQQRKQMAPLVINSRGGRFRTEFKKSAKKSDLEAYRELGKKMMDIDRRIGAMDDAAKSDRAAIDRAINAEMVADTKKPLLRRLDRAVRDAQDKGEPPKALVEARDIETGRIIREKYPDATKEEVERLAPQVQTGQYFHDDPWKDQNIPKLEDLRRQALDAEVEKSGLFGSFPEELQDKILRYSKSKRQYGEKPSPVDPVDNLSAKELASLKKEVVDATKKAVEHNLAEDKRLAAEKVEEQAKEEQLLADAQKVVDSAKRAGTVGGRSAKEVKEELGNKIKDSINETIGQDKTTLTRRGEAEGVIEYTAEGENGGVSLGTIETTDKGKFKVNTYKPAFKDSSVTITVDTLEDAEWAIKAMAAVGKGKTIIAVPGDGIYRLHRFGESLLKLWASARKLDVTKGLKKPEEISSKGISPAMESAQTAVKLYGSAQAALEKIENQMKILDEQPETKYEGKQRQRAEEMLSLLRDWSRPPEEKKSAVPTGEGHTIEGARAEAEKAFGTLSDRVSFVHEPDNPSAAYTDRNKIVVNAAKVAPGTVEKVLLEEGLHGVWNEPAVQDAWKQFRNGVTEYEIAAERAKRKGLDTSRETLKEEAAISKLLAKPDAPLAKRVWDAVIAALDKLFGVKVGDSREELLNAARTFLKGPEAEPEQFRYAAPTTGKAPIENYADALKGIEGEKRSLREQFGDAFDIGSRMSKAKDAFGKGLDGLKATGDFLIDRLKGIERVDDLLRAKGLLSEALETRGRQVYKWVRAAKKAVPQGRYQAAIRKWVDAGGDMAKLQEGARETKPEFRRAYEDAQNLSPENLKIAQETRKYHEARLQDAIDAGVLEDGVTDYIHRMYERRPDLGKKIAAFFQSGILKTNPALTKQRVFEMDWQAEKEGFRPNQSFIDAVAEYESSLSRAIAAREFVKRSNELTAPDGRPVVDIKGMGIPITDEEGKRSGTLIKPQFNPQKANVQGTPNYRADYVNREYPALAKWKWVSSDSGGKPIFVQGDVAIHPDYVQRFDALLEPSRVRYGKYGHIMRPALAVSSAFKQTMLDLSGFHQVQIAVHAAEHKVLPWNIAKDIDFQHPDTQLLLRSGMTIGGEYHYAKEGLMGSSLIRQVPVLGPIAESYHEWLFRDFIPRVKYTMARKALERNRERYAGKMSEEQIGLKTASQANDAFGGQNMIMLERSKTAQDMARLIMLAPDFLESRTKFAASALAMGGKRFGNEQRTALLLGALTMYTAARVINQLGEGHPHFEPENMFSWVHNGQAYSLRTVQGDILHLLEKPLNFWMHRLNPVFGRTLLEAATQRDEFGRKRSPLEMLWDTASNVVPISLRTSRERSIWESMANAFGITDRRWQDTDDAFKLARKWKDEHGIGERGEFIYDPEKDPLRGLKVRLSRNDDVGAASEIKKLLDSKAYTMEKLDAYFRRYRDMAFTGSKTNDKKWQAELTDDQKKTVDAAKDHKQQIAKLYQKARGQYKQALANPP